MKPAEPDGRQFPVLEIGGGHVTGALIALSHDGRTARVVERIDASLDSHASAHSLLDALAAPGMGVSARPGDDWVVAIPGPFDYDAGWGTFDGVAKFGALARVDVRGELARRLGCDGNRLHFVNDADAYGVGEWAFGGHGWPARFVCITLGTGVGSAFLTDGMPVTSGPHVPPDASAHLLEIDGRPLEDAVSSRAIVAEFARRTGRHTTVERIATDARNGNVVATAVLATAMRALGIALEPWINRFEASTLVIGGSIAQSWDIIERQLREAITSPLHDDPPMLVHRSVLLDTAPLLGAASWLARTLTPTSTRLAP